MELWEQFFNDKARTRIQVTKNIAELPLEQHFIFGPRWWEKLEEAALVDLVALHNPSAQFFQGGAVETVGLTR